MDCPRCRASLDERKDARGVAYDRCPSCRGLWLDGGELVQVMGEKAGLTGSQDLLDPKPIAVACPRCKGAMDRGGLLNAFLVVERCRSCAGTWLDRDELRVLRKLLGVGEATEVEAREGQDAPAVTYSPPMAPTASPAAPSGPKPDLTLGIKDAPPTLPAHPSMARPRDDVWVWSGMGSMFGGVCALALAVRAMRAPGPGDGLGIFYVFGGGFMVVLGVAILMHGRLPNWGALIANLLRPRPRRYGYHYDRGPAWWDDPAVWS